MISFEYQDQTYVVNEDVFEGYKFAKTFAMLSKHPEDMDVVASVFEVIEALFDGHDEEYIDRLGGKLDDLMPLIDAAAEAVEKQKGKNPKK